LTPEGRIEQDRAVSLNLARAEGPRAETARWLWASRISPLASLALVIVAIWKLGRRILREL
jgi:hypothetical protein